MPSAVLAIDEFLNPGQVYTFSFKLGHYVPFGAPGQTDIIQDLQAIPYLANVNVTQPALGASTEITFTHNGDGGIAVGQAAGEISAAVQAAHWLVSFDFIEADTGTQGTNEKNPSTVSDAFGGLKEIAIWAAVLIGLLILFEVTATVKQVA